MRYINRFFIPPSPADPSYHALTASLLSDGAKMKSRLERNDRHALEAWFDAGADHRLAKFFRHHEMIESSVARAAAAAAECRVALYAAITAPEAATTKPFVLRLDVGTLAAPAPKPSVIGPDWFACRIAAFVGLEPQLSLALWSAFRRELADGTVSLTATCSFCRVDPNTAHLTVHRTPLAFARVAAAELPRRMATLLR